MKIPGAESFIAGEVGNYFDEAVKEERNFVIAETKQLRMDCPESDCRARTIRQTPNHNDNRREVMFYIICGHDACPAFEPGEV